MKVEDFVRGLDTSYPKRKIDASFVLNNTVDEVKTYLSEAEVKRAAQNDKRREVLNSNLQKKEDLIKHLIEVAGIDEWKIFKKKKKGKGWFADTVRGDMYAHYKRVIEDAQDVVPYAAPQIGTFGNSNCEYDLVYGNITLAVQFNRLHTIEDIFERSIERIKRYEQQVAKSNKHLQVAKEFLDNREEDYSELVTAKEIIGLAEELAQEDYREEQQGLVVDVTHGDGDDCEWEIGDHRCVCGHNRYYLEVEGNLIDGYYSYGVWC